MIFKRFVVTKLYNKLVRASSLFKLSIFKVFEYVAVVVFLPLFVGLFDSLSHLFECGLEHGCELLTHFVDLSLQASNLINLVLFNDLVLGLQFFQVLIELLDFGAILVLLTLQLVALGDKFFES